MKKSKFIIFTYALLFVFNTTVKADCILGSNSNTLKDIYGALRIFRIVAPLLVIGLTVFELVKMLASGLSPDKPGEETPPPKAILAKFVKRVIATIILFLLPSLVDIIFQIAGVWDENHTCTPALENGVTVSEDSSSTINGRPMNSSVSSMNKTCLQYNGKSKKCRNAGCTYNKKSQKCTAG